MMFDVLGMMGNYEDRKIGRFEKGKLTVSTCSVTDADLPYETGIQHPEYNDGDWVIVESYSDKEKAEKGHEKWVKAMTSKNLPKKLEDHGRSFLRQFSVEFGSEMEFKRKSK